MRVKAEDEFDKQRGAGGSWWQWLSRVPGWLAWLLFRFETPQWQAVLRRRADYFPQLQEGRLRPGDPLRGLIQACWLILTRTPQASAIALHRDLHGGARQLWWRVRRRWRWSRLTLTRWLRSLPGELDQRLELTTGQRRAYADDPRSRLYCWGLAAVGLLFVLLSITAPFDMGAQVVFMVALWLLAWVLHSVPGRYVTLMLILLSVIVSCRYLWWRYTSTLHWDDPLDVLLGAVLLLAETYAWLVLLLSFLQSAWPLRRQPVPLPDDRDSWPTVDVLIPTYNEDLAIVRPTVLAAMALDWPHDKLRIHLLDDGKREAFRDFAHEVGINYMTRPDNKGAKAGNLNHALAHTDGELVAIFDCDHIPVCSFLQLTAGWLLRDPRIALVQTPHHFFSPDPFEYNLGVFQTKPNEGALFYGLVQDGNDLWNSTFFCGSCAILRRKALDEIGGFAMDTVTEDAHTALTLHRNGWHSAYIRIPQAAGLATDTLAAHINQRIRWARGMVQIFRMDNPLFGKGLSLFQRLCYTNAMLHFFSGLPRLIFLTAPLAFLILHAYIIYASALVLVLYVLPHMAHASLVNSRIQGAFRDSFWSEVYEAVLAWYIAWPTTLALFSPKHGKFNVTEKGKITDSNRLDWRLSLPYLVLALLNVIGLGFAVWRFFTGPANETGTVIISTIWVVYNLLMIGAALAVAVELQQSRRSHRVQATLPAAFRLPDGHLFPAVMQDYSEGGVKLSWCGTHPVPLGTQVQLLLMHGEREFAFPAEVVRSHDRELGLLFGKLSLVQRLAYVQCTFARADNWLIWNGKQRRDRPLRSLREIIMLGFRGYWRAAHFAPAPLRKAFFPLVWLGRCLAGFLPRFPKVLAVERSVS